MADLTSAELTEELLAWARGLPFPERDEWPLWRWQRWMRERPSDAWQVLGNLVQLAPEDPEVMDHAARQAALLISYDFNRFCPLVTQLLPSSHLFASMVGPEVFVSGHYGPRYRTVDELASVWLRHNLHSRNGHRLREVIEGDSKTSVAVALEIIARGPLYGFDSDGVDTPLLDCLQHHGPLVIAAIEEAAHDSVAVRRAIWTVRRLNSKDDPRAVAPALWGRFQTAAAGTTTYNSDLPPGVKTALDPEVEVIVEDWFGSEATFWAWSELSDLVRKDPEQAWLAILAIVRLATSDQARCDCGCGPLEDLIRADPALFIERIEYAASNDHAFQDALACVWLTLEDVPKALANRYFIASGHMLSILDEAPE